MFIKANNNQLIDENEEYEENDVVGKLSSQTSPVQDDNLKLFQTSRSKTMPPSALNPTSTKKNKELVSSTSTSTSIKTINTNTNNSNSNVNTDRLKIAKEEAEKAIKVFSKRLYAARIPENKISQNLDLGHHYNPKADIFLLF